MHCAEASSGVQKIVRTAKQADVPCFGAAESGNGLDVVQLEKSTSSAASAISGNEGAPTAIPPVRFSPHRHRYVAFASVGLRCASLGRSGLGRQ